MKLHTISPWIKFNYLKPFKNKKRRGGEFCHHYQAFSHHFVKNFPLLSPVWNEWKHNTRNTFRFHETGGRIHLANVPNAIRSVKTVHGNCMTKVKLPDLKRIELTPIRFRSSDTVKSAASASMIKRSLGAKWFSLPVWVKDFSWTILMHFELLYFNWSSW